MTLICSSTKPGRNTEMGGNQIDKDPSKLTIRQQVLAHPPLLITINSQLNNNNNYIPIHDENDMLNIKFPAPLVLRNDSAQRRRGGGRLLILRLRGLILTSFGESRWSLMVTETRPTAGSTAVRLRCARLGLTS